MRTILLDANHQEETRLAVLEQGKLQDLSIQYQDRPQYKSNIYLGIVARIEPGLEAIFVDHGNERHGFLPFKDIPLKYFEFDANEESANDKERARVREAMRRTREAEAIDTLDEGEVIVGDEEEEDFAFSPKKNTKRGRLTLKVGDSIIVQVSKEERDKKGASLTGFVSIPSRYLVYLPDASRSGGISRSMNQQQRDELREITQQIRIPEGNSLIVRSAGAARGLEELQGDLDHLVAFWTEVSKAAAKHHRPGLLISENDIVTQLLRDYLRDDVDAVWIDNEKIYEECVEKAKRFIPKLAKKIQHHKDKSVPIFSRFHIEKDIQAAHQSRVELSSGASIVIDITEALVCIDVNSARATSGGDIEETAFTINKEAAEEIARQLRIRDLGGLVVIDFIDMTNPDNQRRIEKVLLSALSHDRARIQIGRISRFGLLEMSRQRLGTSLRDASGTVCPRCMGSGRVMHVSALAANVLRICDEIIARKNLTKLVLEVPKEVASYLSNEKREHLLSVEQNASARINVVPNSALLTPHYRILDNLGGQTLVDTSLAESAVRTLRKMTPKQALLSQDLFFVAAPRPSLWRRFLGLFKSKKIARKTTRQRKPQGRGGYASSRGGRNGNSHSNRSRSRGGARSPSHNPRRRNHNRNN